MMSQYDNPEPVQPTSAFDFLLGIIFLFLVGVLINLYVEYLDRY